MDRQEILKDIIRRYNNKEGNIKDLLTDYEDYSKDKFYRDLKKNGIVKDKERDIYIYEGIDGQIDLLEEEEKEIPEPKPKADTRKKKTFEIDESIEPYIKAEAIKQGVTLNDWVNDTLWKAISDSTKEFIND